MVKICCVGAGYEGSSTMSVLALKCPDARVFLIDPSNQNLIEQWERGENPITEPELNDIVAQCRGRNLFFSHENIKCIREADIIFLSPDRGYFKTDDRADVVRDCGRATREIVSACTSPKVIVGKATYPLESTSEIEAGLKGDTSCDHVMLSIPEFSERGRAIQDLLNPQQIVIGCHDTLDGRNAALLLKEIYMRWVPEDKISVTGLYSADIIKLASSALLAEKMTSINAIAAVCNYRGVNITEVSGVISKHPRIGSGLLNPNLGFSGSRYRDTLDLVNIYKQYDEPDASWYWNRLIERNLRDRCHFANRVCKAKMGAKVAVFGFACNKDMCNTVFCPAASICQYLLDDGCVLSIYDPLAMREQILAEFISVNELDQKLNVAPNPYQAAEGCGCICILTACDYFRNLDYRRIYAKIEQPACIFDGHDILDHEELKSIGFSFYSIGKGLGDD